MLKSINEFSPKHLIKVMLEENLKCFPITNIIEKCIWMETKRHSIISSFPNRVERY